MKEFLSQIHTVENEVMQEYLSNWTTYSVPKNTILTWEGDTEKYMYFVLEGVQKSYYTHGNKEHIIAFTYFPSLSGIPESFLSQSASKYFLEAITDTSWLFQAMFRSCAHRFSSAIELTRVVNAPPYYLSWCACFAKTFCSIPF